MAQGRLESRSAEREAIAARVMLRVLDRTNLEGRTLVVEDMDSAVERRVDDVTEFVAWRRRALDARGARHWVPDGPFQSGIVRLPRSWDEFELTLHAVASQLVEGGRVWVYGANDEGIKSVPKRLDRALYPTVETVELKHRCRVLELVRSGSPARGELAQWRQSSVVELPDGRSLELTAYPGTFAPGRLDEGSAELLQALPDVRGAVLDFATGVGTLAAALRGDIERLAGCDADALAIHAAQENVPGADLQCGDAWGGAPDGVWDLVLSNPPIHLGHGEDYGVLAELIRGAPRRLRRGGRLVLVVQRTVGAGRLMQQAFESPRRIRHTRRFEVWEGRVPT